METRRPRRDTATLKAKFEKLANTRKPTEVSSFPQDVRRAEKSAKGMLLNSSAVVAGRFKKDEDDDKITGVDASTRNRKRVVIEVSSNKRANGAKVVKRKDDNSDALI